MSWAGANLTRSKVLQREQSTLSSEKELKLTNLRTLSDELNRKTLRMGELRGKQQQRKMDEASLKDQQELISALQRELKVRSMWCG